MFACSFSLLPPSRPRLGRECALFGAPIMVSKAESLPAARAELGIAPLSLDDAYARYTPYVAKLGLRLLGRPDEVDDLIQDVFVVATERFSSLRDPGALRGWLAAITVRTAVRRLRRRRLMNLIFPRAAPSSHDLSTFLSEGATSDQRFLLGEVFRILEGVPVKERVAWSLRVLEEEPLERVAELCACSLATAKRRVAAAQAAIDEVLER